MVTHMIPVWQADTEDCAKWRWTTFKSFQKVCLPSKKQVSILLKAGQQNHAFFSLRKHLQGRSPFLSDWPTPVPVCKTPVPRTLFEKGNRGRGKGLGKGAIERMNGCWETAEIWRPCSYCKCFWGVTSRWELVQLLSELFHKSQFCKLNETWGQPT